MPIMTIPNQVGRTCREAPPRQTPAFGALRTGAVRSEDPKATAESGCCLDSLLPVLSASEGQRWL